MFSAFLCGSGTSRGFITSDGSIMLKLKGEANTAVLYMMLNMTHRGQHCRLYNVIQMEANPFCVMLNVTQTGKHCPLVWCPIWLTEANIAILCEAEVDTGENAVVLYHDVAQRGKLCHLVWYWRRCQVCYWCYWCIIEDSRKRQHHHRHLEHKDN